VVHNYLSVILLLYTRLLSCSAFQHLNIVSISRIYCALLIEFFLEHNLNQIKVAVSVIGAG
jgi:hypothetical protein